MSNFDLLTQTFQNKNGNTTLIENLNQSKVQLGTHSQQPNNNNTFFQNSVFHGGFHFVPEFLDPHHSLSQNSFEEFNAVSNFQQNSSDKIQSADDCSTKISNTENFTFEREARWSEVRKYTEFIQRFANEASHIEVSKDNYFELYNMAVCLLKAVDSLDPDKIQQQKKTSELVSPPQMPTNPQFLITPSLLSQIGIQQPTLELLQARKSFDYYYNSSLDGVFLQRDIPFIQSPPFNPFIAPGVVYHNNQMMIPKVEKRSENYNENPSSKQQSQPPHNCPSPDDNKRSKRQRRRKQAYSSKRHLHCLNCGATETPEWRRGPSGDHTLCNACGLHYAKTLKKQKKDPEVFIESINTETSISSDHLTNSTNIPSIVET